MPTTYGITETGFVIKPLDVIKQELEDLYHDKFGQALDVQPETPAGMQIGIHSEREYNLWLIAQAIVAKLNPRSATGIAFDNILAFSNNKRLKAASTKTTERLYGTPGTPIPSGTIISVLGNSDIKFITDENCVIAAAVNEKQEITFNEVPTSGTYTLTFDGQTTSALAYNANAATIQAALIALSNIDSGSVSVSGDYTNGFIIEFISTMASLVQDLITATSSLLGSLGAVTISTLETVEGGSYVDIGITATTTGPLTAYAGTITVIETPINGLETATNKLDATIGRNIETDPEAKIRRNQNLVQTKSATLEGIINAVKSVSGVTKVSGFENNEDEVVDGRPGHSIEIVVEGGTDLDIANAIWNSKSGGIQFVGTEEVTITDSQSIERLIKFNRSVDVLLYVILDILKETGTTISETDVKNSVLAYGNSLEMGSDVLPNAELIGYITDPDLVTFVPNIRDISVKVGTANPPTTNTPIVINPNQTAKFDSARITVNIT